MSKFYSKNDRILFIGSSTIWDLMHNSALSEYHLDRAQSMDHALDRFSKNEYNLLIWETDEDPSESHKGLEVLEVIQKDSPITQVVTIVPEHELDLALQGLDIGAFQFLKKPVNILELSETARLALEKAPIAEQSRLLDKNKQTGDFEGIIGNSKAIKKVIEQIKQVSLSDATVLVQGETGTGKDLVAAAIHRHSQRKEHPFIAVNTGAIPSDLIDAELMGYAKGAFTGATTEKVGYFEQANHGTLFLDEIGTMPHRVQVSLLRILEKKPFRRVGGRKNITTNARIIGATNENLLSAVKQKRFREDLFYRFDMFPIHLPPLRERAGDIQFLARTFIHQFARKYNKLITDISEEAIHYIERYPWPGNVRELKNMIQRACLICDDHVLETSHLNSRITQIQEENGIRFRPGMTLSEIEEQVIESMLHQYSKSDTASMLGISRKTLYNKMVKYKLNKTD